MEKTKSDEESCSGETRKNKRSTRLCPDLIVEGAHTSGQRDTSLGQPLLCGAPHVGIQQKGRLHDCIMHNDNGEASWTKAPPIRQG